jgi:hypothetical protein
MKDTIRKGKRIFPTELRLKVSMFEYTLSNDNKLIFRSRLSIAFHLEIDRATKRINQTVETYLRMFIDYV